MRTPLAKETAERRVVHKFNKLFVPLVELCDAIRNLEPYNLIDDIILSRTGVDGAVTHLEYKTKPITVTVIDKDKQLALQISRRKKRKKEDES